MLESTAPEYHEGSVEKEAASGDTQLLQESGKEGRENRGLEILGEHDQRGKDASRDSGGPENTKGKTHRASAPRGIGSGQEAPHGRMTQADMVLNAYAEGCRTTKEVAEKTGMSIKRCSAYSSALFQSGYLEMTGLAERWAKRGSQPKA